MRDRSMSDGNSGSPDDRVFRLSKLMLERNGSVEDETHEEDDEEYKEPGEDVTVKDCFLFALEESPMRGKKFDAESIARKVDDDPHDKKSKSLEILEDICTISLFGRVIDRVASEIIRRNYDPLDAEQDDVLGNLLQTFPSEFCTKEHVKLFYDDLIDHAVDDDNKTSGVNQHPLVVEQHVPRPMRILLATSWCWKKMNFNRRKAAIRHSLSEFPHQDILDLHAFLQVDNCSRMTADDAS